MNDVTITLLLRALYEAEKRLAERNYAKAHGFEEWVNHKFPKRK